MSREVQPSWARLGALLALVAGPVICALFGARPPAALDASAPGDVFSAGRAMVDVRGLVGEAPTHAIGTPAHASARAYVERRLRELGLEPDVERTRLCRSATDCFDVENVVARLDGGAPPAILLAAHYDSVEAGPGAADDAAGTAVVLELARILRAQRMLPHPVVVLIDDGEELGLLGAREFVRTSPYAKEIGVVLNFEARGNFGQTAMFETSDGNDWLIDAYAHVDRPTASSLIYTLYQKLPNDTDLTVFKKAGMLGLDFAFADGVWDYHTPRDSPDRLDPRSVQHMGDQALATLEALLTADLARPAVHDAVYFDLFSLVLVRYPASLATPLAFAAAVALAFALHRGKRAGVLGAVGVLRGVFVALLAPVVAFAAGAVVFAAMCARVGAPKLPLAGPLPAWISLTAVAVAATSALGLLLTRNVDARAALGGVLVFQATLAVTVAGALPGASYLFLFPLVFGAGALVLCARRESAAARLPFLGVAAAVSAVVFFPVLRILLVMVGTQLHAATTVSVALVTPSFLPLLVDVGGTRRWLLPGGALAVAVVAGAFVTAA